MSGAWQPLETAPDNEAVLLATTGGWVGEATFMGTREDGTQAWFWADGDKLPINPALIPLGWQPLPDGLTERVQQ